MLWLPLHISHINLCHVLFSDIVVVIIYLCSSLLWFSFFPSFCICSSRRLHILKTEYHIYIFKEKIKSSFLCFILESFAEKACCCERIKRTRLVSGLNQYSVVVRCERCADRQSVSLLTEDLNTSPEKELSSE